MADERHVGIHRFGPELDSLLHDYHEICTMTRIPRIASLMMVKCDKSQMTDDRYITIFQ